MKANWRFEEAIDDQTRAWLTKALGPSVGSVQGCVCGVAQATRQTPNNGTDLFVLGVRHLTYRQKDRR